MKKDKYMRFCDKYESSLSAISKEAKKEGLDVLFIIKDPDSPRPHRYFSIEQRKDADEPVIYRLTEIFNVPETLIDAILSFRKYFLDLVLGAIQKNEKD